MAEAEINKIYGAHHKNFKDDRPILLAAKCRPMIVVSKNIRYMWIFAGVPLGRHFKYNKCYMQPFANGWRHSCNMCTYLFTANMCQLASGHASWLRSSPAVWSTRTLLREFEWKNETCHILVPNELTNAELLTVQLGLQWNQSFITLNNKTHRLT